MIIKPGASLRGIQPEIVATFPVIDRIGLDHGYEPTLTCGTDGTHRNGSLHYVGLASDFRTRDLPESLPPVLFRQQIHKALGATVMPNGEIVEGEYDVVLESDHVHVEYQPKKALNR